MCLATYFFSPQLNDRLSLYEVFTHPNLQLLFCCKSGTRLQQCVGSHWRTYNTHVCAEVQGMLDIRVRVFLLPVDYWKKVFAQDTTYRSTDEVSNAERGITQELKTDMLYSSRCLFNLVFPVGLNLKLLNMTGLWKNSYAYRNQIRQGTLLC